jgi:hypothetical protein
MLKRLNQMLIDGGWKFDFEDDIGYGDRIFLDDFIISQWYGVLLVEKNTGDDLVTVYESKQPKRVYDYCVNNI